LIFTGFVRTFVFELLNYS